MKKTDDYITEVKRLKEKYKNKIEVQVFDSSGNLIMAGNTTSAAQRINVYFDAKDVERFYTELARGTLRVVKACESE